jgi:hypothetical protein
MVNAAELRACIIQPIVEEIRPAQEVALVVTHVKQIQMVAAPGIHLECVCVASDFGQPLAA